jgi:CRISPR system Cascade subunit CasC
VIYEFHAIQSFAPANLNRDDLGLPKECTFGGARRARVSSQSWKRAMRQHFAGGVADLDIATRTKRAHGEIVERLVDQGLEESLAAHRASVVLEADPLGVKVVADNADAKLKTGQLLFFRAADLDALAAVAIEHGEAIDEQPSVAGHPDRPDKKKSKPVLPKEAHAAVKRALTSPSKAVDVALFGRMVAEMPEANVDASCQVAHAIGTHRLTAEDDYFTAVDDLKPDETEGADMIGTVSFNASCFYRYAAIDERQLAKNLGVEPDDAAVRAAIAAFARAFTLAVPTGKQNTFAAQNPPTAVLAVRRGAGQCNLANAFVKPVDAAKVDAGVDVASVERMLAHYVRLTETFGGTAQAFLLSTADIDGGLATPVSTLDALVSALAEPLGATA